MKRIIKRILISMVIIFLLVVLSLCAFCVWTLHQRKHGSMESRNSHFTETAKEINNKARGFYHIHGFRIKDENIDYDTLIYKRFRTETDANLAMIQINLRSYREGDISEQGMHNLDRLFQALQNIDRKYIVRFLYDWDGKNLESEPESIEIILRHMEQVAPVLKKYQTSIYMLQGLFIGNCGEMHTTKFGSDEDIFLLAQQLANVTGDNMFLSVRTPVQWRKITKQWTSVPIDQSMAKRWGLFNDGILGNSGDCGTYGDKPASEENRYFAWYRKDELAFQEGLCRYVPNGGEVVLENELNDFDYALEAFRTMHLSYLNWDHDRNVLNKWAETVVHEDSCFDGMDGLTYMERHLGYRYLIEESLLSYDIRKDILHVEVDLKNVGFAPIYEDNQAVLTILDEQGETVYTGTFTQDLRSLCGGNDYDETLTYALDVCITGWPGWEQEQYQLYFGVKTESSDGWLELANEQAMYDDGYHIGTLMGGVQ